MQPLKNIRVVEWGEFVSAPYCARLLADLGAEVVKVEPPEGDLARGYGPFPGGTPDPEASGLFIALNAGKQSVVLDAEREDQRAKLRDMALSADIFVTNVPLAERRRLELDPARLAERAPRLITVGLSVFGETGPAAEAPQTALDAYAVGGVAHAVGTPGRAPLIIPFHQADFQAGAHGAAGATLALIARRRTGRGQNVDVASADILAMAAGTNAMIYIHYGLKWARAGSRASGSGGPYPYAILPCKDGLVCLIGRARQEWVRLVEAMGNPEWAGLPRYQDLQAMGRDYPDEVDDLITPWLMCHTRADLLALAARYNFPVGPLRTMDEVVATSQFAHRNFFRDIPNAAAGSVTAPGVPWSFGGKPDIPRPAPRLGQHSQAIFGVSA